MNTHPIWQLTIYDQTGQTVAIAEQFPNGQPDIHGDMILLAESLPAITSLTRFFTDPDERARACYTAYQEAYEATYDTTLPTWDELKSLPNEAARCAVWRATAAAAAAVDPTLN
jgi:hypothetical protein